MGPIHPRQAPLPAKHLASITMNKIFRSLALATLTLSVALLAEAQGADVPAAQLATIKQNLAKRFARLPAVESARTTPMAGLIEIKAGRQIFYTDANGDYIIEGSLIDTRAQKNLTEERMEEVNKVDFATFPLKDAVVWKNGNGRRKMVVFADPNCGYCKKLEAEYQQLRDVTVYTFMIPILGGDGQAKIDNIWCAKDRTQAWRDWMLNKTQPDQVACSSSPSQRNLDLSQKLGINGTPAAFFEDGSRLPGYEAAAGIEQRLKKAMFKVAG
jgi:thiol:disulfide interchange protein DsbC